jgi:hypothetical protein
VTTANPSAPLPFFVLSSRDFFESCVFVFASRSFAADAIPPAPAPAPEAEKGAQKSATRSGKTT